MATWVWAVIAIVVVGVIALLAVGAAKRRTAVLRDRFGPEYERAVKDRGGRRAAEIDLRAREKQRAQFEVKPLPEAGGLRFADQWRDVQERFVDQPAQAVTAADALITDVMEAQGYPMKDSNAKPTWCPSIIPAPSRTTGSRTRCASVPERRRQAPKTCATRWCDTGPCSTSCCARTATVSQIPALTSRCAIGDRQGGTADPGTQDAGTSAVGPADDPAPTGSDDPGLATTDTAYSNQQVDGRGGR